ncbi:hypothetical protein C0995_007573 [Termitomyces sp. Mi166|nr:hypothetical protein C0995_007573 [Termitomyces sp. Mi166\
MTNATSGHKRSWDGADYDSHKRPREEARDWRDVHLKSLDRRSSTSKTAADKRYSDGRRRDDRQRDDRQRDDDRKRDDYRRANDHRGRRDERERDRDRERGHREERRRSASREEGEISPRPDDNSPRRSPRPEPSSAPPPAPAPPLRPPSPLPEMELDLPSSPPPVEDLMAARRAKREAIRAKYNGVASVDATPSPSSAVQPPPLSSNVSDAVTRAPSISGTPAPPVPNTANNSGKRDSMSASPAPEDFALAKDGEEEGVPTAENTGAEQISAADYDPSLDRREDERRRIREPALAIEAMVIDEEEEIEEVEEEEDVDDMFSVATTMKQVKKVKKTLKIAAPALVTTNLDSAADPEGYYTIILGEQLDGRYQVFSSIGKGMFANVVRARVIAGDPREIGKEVAIKIVRCQESMYKAGQKEAGILVKLKEADPDDKKHIVRLERTFEHRGHLCLVFEAMSMNLRDVVKRFGKDVGLNIRAVRAYAHQLFLALSLLRKCNIMHADIKPDNILVNEQKTLLKLCDLGSASDAAENDITPYLVSRFYRAPEIILGVPYDPALDIWSIGCTLYELYTGKILFPGRSNNQMLLLMMELKGRFNSKMIKRAKFGDVFFDDMGAFESVETDRVTSAAIVRKVHISKPTRDLRARLMPPASAKLKDDENKLIVSFIDLLDKCLALDPTRRISPKEALMHPFLHASPRTYEKKEFNARCLFRATLTSGISEMTTKRLRGLLTHFSTRSPTKETGSPISASDPRPELALPTYDKLPTFKDLPGCAWGIWGEDDQLGTVNLLTEKVVQRAAREEILTGHAISLNWPLNFPEKPVFKRKTPEVKTKLREGGKHVVRDDEIHINTQSGTQWDGLRHYGVVEHGVYYNKSLLIILMSFSVILTLPPFPSTPGLSLSVGVVPMPDPNAIDPSETKLGIQNWADHGICGRGVLLDLVRYQTKGGTIPLPYDPWTTHAITVADLEACAAAQGVTFRQGDILLLRVGFIQKYGTASQEDRDALPGRPETLCVNRSSLGKL